MKQARRIILLLDVIAVIIIMLSACTVGAAETVVLEKGDITASFDMKKGIWRALKTS